MPDSAVKNVPPSVKSARPSRRTGDASANSSTDIDKKLARAARSAQRLAQLSSAPAGDTTLDLFSEETERATFQAMNTDIRQGTLAGFELPEVFMAAVQSTAINGEAGSGKRAGRALTASAAEAPCFAIDHSMSDAAGTTRGKAVSAARVVSATSAAAAKRDGGTASDPSAATRFEDEAESTAPTRLNAATVTDADTGSNVPEAFSADSKLNEAAPIDAAAASSASRALGATSESNATTQPVAPGASPHQQAASATNPASRHGAEAVPIGPVHASAVVTARSTSGADSSTDSTRQRPSAASQNLKDALTRPQRRCDGAA